MSSNNKKSELVKFLKDFNIRETISSQSSLLSLSSSSLDNRKRPLEIVKFETMFKRPKYSVYWDNSLDLWNGVNDDMKLLMNVFAKFDPINDLRKFNRKWVNEETETLDNCDSVKGTFDKRGEAIVYYLKHKNFNQELLNCKKWDYVVNAILTFLLSSSLCTLLWIKMNYSEFSYLIDAIYAEKYSSNDCRLFVMDLDKQWIYTRAPFKILSKYFIPQINNDGNKPFSLFHYLDGAFFRELDLFYLNLNNNLIDEDYTKFLERRRMIPYDIQHLIGDYNRLLGKSNVRYFTGQACCGKTTLVKQLNFDAKSRSSIGGFSGKVNNLATVSCLHFSIDFVLRQYKNIIGVS